jgi:Skp family chaperone for outer membrane proteins
MTVSRLDQELADALGLAQAVRHAAAGAQGRGAPAKLEARLAGIERELAALQEELNALVVADRTKRGSLTGRSRRLREAEERRVAGDADLLDALQALAADAAHAAAQWRVVRALAKASGDREVRRIAKRALPAAEAHLDLALDACSKVAKAHAPALVAPPAAAV